ncbi:MAG: benzodiazapine receptor [Paracoccaceae bacterium]|jgi:tryptophan-rich sensory protein
MDWIVFAIFFAACCAAGATGAMFSPGPWYRDLVKPWWTPPGWVFPVVWSTLYFCMAGAGMRAAIAPDNLYAMAFWSLQIALNTLWSPVFFGLHHIRAGAVIIVSLWIAVFGATIALWDVDPVAGMLFAPYLLWVTIAAALNFSVLRLNPDAKPVVTT